jgi:hypothetical protein
MATWLGWGTIAALILVLFAIGVPPEYQSHLETARAGLEPELASLGLTDRFYALYRTFLDTFEAVAFLAIGALVFFSKPRDRMTILVSVANMTFGMLFVPTLLTIAKLQPELMLPVGFVRALGLASSLIVLYYLFPDGRFVPRWSRYLGMGWGVLALAWWLEPRVPANLVYLDSWQQNMALSYSLFLVSYSTGIAAQFYRFRRVSNPIQRQQTKFVVFGTTTAFTGFLLYHIPIVFFPVFSEPSMPRLIQVLIGIPAYHLMILMAPATIALSILRYRLWDIDLVINRSLVSGLLSITLGSLYVGVVVAGSTLITAMGGGDNPGLVTVLATLLIAAVFNPVRGRMQKLVDRRFFRRKYDTIRTLNDFSAAIRDEVDLGALSTQLVRVVSATMQPERVSVVLLQPVHPEQPAWNEVPKRERPSLKGEQA